MSETEALEILIEQFAGETGIIPRLRAGLGLDEKANARVCQALDVLQEAWREKLRIPKRAVWAFVHIDDTIWQMSEQYEDLDLPRLQINLSERIEKCLLPDPVIEDEYQTEITRLVPGSPSIRIYDALMDENCLLMALHAGNGFDAQVVADLFDAMSAFGASHRDADEIPRIIAYPLATLSGYIAGRWGIYLESPQDTRRDPGPREGPP